MTEGHDDVDDRPIDDDTDDGRDQEEKSDSGWDQPWPSETRSEQPETASNPASSGQETEPQERSQSNHKQRVQEQRDDPQNTGHARIQESHDVSPQGTPQPEGTNTAVSGTQGHPEEGQSIDPRGRQSVASRGERSVEITEDAQGDGNWVDLGEYRAKGETLAVGDLTEEEILEYTTERRSLNPLVQVHWGIRVTIGAIIVGLIATWALGALGFNPQLGGAVVGLFVLLGLTWVALYYRLWVYQIRADAIYLERGVVTHVRSLVPYVRIQHVDTSQSPIERMLGLSTLVVYTAGSRGADVSIPGLLPEEARDLQRRVKELAIEAEGDDAL